MDHAAFVETFLPITAAMALAVARPLGLMTAFPVFGWFGLQGMVRYGAAVGLSIPMFGAAYFWLRGAGADATPQLIAALAAKEFFVGAVLGVLFGAPFWAAETAGTYVDVYRGDSSATIMSPESDDETLITGAILNQAMIAIFLSIGGITLLLEAMYRSYGLWPLFEIAPNIAAPLQPLFWEVLAQVFRIGLALGAPILIAMFLGEFCLALASRFAPQMNLFDSALSVKNLIYLFILPPYLYMLVTYFANDALDIHGMMDLIERAAQ